MTCSCVSKTFNERKLTLDYNMKPDGFFSNLIDFETIFKKQKTHITP